MNVTDSEGHWATAHETIGVQDGSTAPSAGFGGADDLVLTVAGRAALAFLAVGLAWRIAVRAQRGQGRPQSVRPRGAGGSSSGEPSRPSGPSGASPALAGAAGPAVPASRATGNSPQADPRVVPDPRGLQLTQRVILHIGAQGRLSPDDVAPPGLTQAGIADALGTGQNSVTNVLRRLVAAGVVVHDVRHVSGQPRRLRVYRFTDRGESVYRDLWNRSNARGGAGGAPWRNLSVGTRTPPVTRILRVPLGRVDHPPSDGSASRDGPTQPGPITSAGPQARGLANGRSDGAASRARCGHPSLDARAILKGLRHRAGPGARIAEGSPAQSQRFVVGWGDLDGNNHMGNTAILDRAADTRFLYFAFHGFPGQRFAAEKMDR